MAGSATVTGSRIWKQLGLAFLVMGGGLAIAITGLVGDFYQHEIAGFSPELESIYAPVHLLILGGIGLTGLGFLLGAFGLRREGHNPLRMLVTEATSEGRS